MDYRIALEVIEWIRVYQTMGLGDVIPSGFVG